MPYVVDASAEEPIILINTHLGFDSEDGQGINGDEWARELLALDSMGKKTIKCWINSPGGSVVDGWAMYNAMMQVRAKVDTYCIGMAASMSAILFQGGRNRVMMDYSILMYHNPFGPDASNDMLNAFKKSLVTMVSKRSGKDSNYITDMFDKTTYMTADEAKMLGMCDMVEASEDYNKKRATPITNIGEAKQYYKTNSLIFNSLLQKPTIMPSIKVTNKLKLTEGANDDQIVDAINAIESRATVAETALGNEKLKTTEITNSLTKVTGERDEAIKERDALKTKWDNLEKEAKGIKAKELVATALKQGKITNNAANIKAWEDRAAADFDGINALLASIPSTSKAPNIVADAKAVAEDGTGTPGAGATIVNSIAQDMAALQAKHMTVK